MCKPGKTWAKNNGKSQSIPVFRTTLLSWGDFNDYPTLSSKVKGAVCKVIFQFVCFYGMNLVHSGKDTSGISVMRACCTWHMLRFNEVCEDGGVILSVEEAQLACWHGWQYLLLYQALATHFFHENECKYKLRPKLHYFSHLLMELIDTRENPHKQDSLRCSLNCIGLFGVTCTFSRRTR